MNLPFVVVPYFLQIWLMILIRLRLPLTPFETLFFVFILNVFFANLIIENKKNS
jgi:hypothetical protein